MARRGVECQYERLVCKYRSRGHSSTQVLRKAIVLALQASSQDESMEIDYFTKDVSFTEQSEGFIRAGFDHKDPACFKSKGVSAEFARKYSSSDNSKSIELLDAMRAINFVAEEARECYDCSAASRGRLACSIASHFWSMYKDIANKSRFRGDLRSIWLLYHSSNPLLRAMMPRLLTLRNERWRSSEEVHGNFSTLYRELLCELMINGLVPRKARLSYRYFLNRFLDQNFRLAPVCQCCLRRVCTAVFLKGLPEDLYGAELITERDEHSKEVTTNLSVNDEEVEGDAMRLLLEQKLVKLSDDCLDVLMSNRGCSESQTNDFVVSDVTFLLNSSGSSLRRCQLKDRTLQLVREKLRAAAKFANSDCVNEMSEGLLRELICFSYFPRVGALDHDCWLSGMMSDEVADEEPKTGAHLLWLAIWREVKRNITARSSDSSSSLERTFMTKATSAISMLMCEWVRLCFETSAINKIYFDLPAEALVANIYFGVLEARLENFSEGTKEYFRKLHAAFNDRERNFRERVPAGRLPIRDRRSVNDECVYMLPA